MVGWNMFNIIELFLINHNDSLLLVLTSTLVFTNIISLIINYLVIREMRKQIRFQNKIFLENTLNSYRSIIFKLKSNSIDSEGQRKVLIDEAITNSQREIDIIEKKLKKIKSD